MSSPRRPRSARTPFDIVMDDIGREEPTLRALCVMAAFIAVLVLFVWLGV